MYKRIAGAEDQATLADVRAELQDRYGTPPESVLNLLAAGELRLRCEQLGIAQLDRKRTQIEQGKNEDLRRDAPRQIRRRSETPTTAPRRPQARRASTPAR